MKTTPFSLSATTFLLVVPLPGSNLQRPALNSTMFPLLELLLTLENIFLKREQFEKHFLFLEIKGTSWLIWKMRSERSRNQRRTLQSNYRSLRDIGARLSPVINNAFREEKLGKWSEGGNINCKEAGRWSELMPLTAGDCPISVSNRESRRYTFII